MKIVLFIACFSFAAFSTPPFVERVELSDTDGLKVKVFQILQAKCNVCHEQQNKRMVFTLENMDKRAPKINRQVFKWKRMPKGNDIKLSIEETALLKNWIANLNKK